MTQERNRANAKAELADAAKRRIETNYAEPFSLEAIANELFVNRHYLDRVFKQATGDTLLHYHNYVRCQAAKALLLRPEHSIAFIGRQVGYISASHFAHVFKNFCGCTPSAYRNHCGNHSEV